MIDVIKTLLNKTEEIENSTEKLKSSSNIQQILGVTCFKKNLLNYQILSGANIKITDFKAVEGNNLYFNLLVSLYLESEQNVEFSLIVNNIAIYKATKHISVGYSEITLISNFLPIDDDVSVEVRIVPKSGKIISVLNMTLSVWGVNTGEEKYEYQATKISDKFILSYVYNNLLYYALVDQQVTSITGDEFTLYSSAKSHAFIYDETNDIIYLFRVDTSGNLFYSDFDDHNEIFICSGVSKVSASADGENISVAYINNEKCYVFSIIEGVISEITKIDINVGIISDCYLYFNSYNGKLYLILTTDNNANYMLERIKENDLSGENISAEISFSITTYEVNNEI